jgi:hypothetical protein
MLRERGMFGAARSSQLCQINAEITTEEKKFAVEAETDKAESITHVTLRTSVFGILVRHLKAIAQMYI